MLIALEQITFLFILSRDSLEIVFNSWFLSCCKWEGSSSSHCSLSCHRFCRIILLAMTAGLNIPRGTNMDAVVASTLRIVLAVGSVSCTWVVLFLFPWRLDEVVESHMVVSPLGISEVSCDLIVHISSWNDGTDPSVPVPACVLWHVIFALKKGEKIQVAWVPPSLAV